MSENVSEVVTTNNKMSKFSIIAKIFSYVFLIGLFKSLGTRFSILLSVILISLIYFIGKKFTDWYMKRSNVSFKLIKWIAWSNVATWLLPPLGAFTGFCTFRFGEHVIEQQTKYRVLGTIGMLSAVINAAIGVIMNISSRY